MTSSSIPHRKLAGTTAEDLSIDDLRATFPNARRRGLLDIAGVRASAARVEWRPSLAVLHQVIDELEE